MKRYFRVLDTMTAILLLSWCLVSCGNSNEIPEYYENSDLAVTLHLPDNNHINEKVRCVVAEYDGEAQIATEIVYADVDSSSDISFSIIPDEECKVLLFWIDLGGNNDNPYEVSYLNNIERNITDNSLSAVGGNACAYSGSVSLNNLKNTELYIVLQKPMAQYTIIAADAGDYLHEISKNSLEGYFAKVSYGGFYPNHFNLLLGKMLSSVGEVSFIYPLTDCSNGETTVASDYLFVGDDDTFVTLVLEIINTVGDVVAKTSSINIAIRKGENNVLRMRLFSVSNDDNIDINTDFDGQFDIKI